MGFRDLLLVALLVFLLVVPCHAGTCFSESDCPRCSIDGMTLVKSTVSESTFVRDSVYPSEYLDCVYESDKVMTDNPDLPSLYDSMDVRVSCYNTEADASQWYNYHKGTGEKPVKDNTDKYASLYGRARESCIQGFLWGKTGTTTKYTSYSCSQNYSVTNRFLIGFSPKTRYTFEENNKPRDLEANLLGRDQKYMDCFAGFSPKPAPATGEKALHGTVTATKIPYGIEYPLGHAKLELFDITSDQDRRPVGETTTDGDGKYRFRDALEPGRKYELLIYLTYYDSKEYFSLYMGTADSESNKVILPYDFTYSDEKDLEQNIDLDSLWSGLGAGGENPYGILYVHTAEAFEFYRDQLHEDINLNLPLKVVAFIPEGIFRKDIKAMYYIDPDSGLSMIAIGPEESGPRSEFRPINREFHEFSHYMMTNIYGGYPASRVKSEIPVINHDGYVNPSTSDSWQEGFAEFMAVVIGEHYGYSCNGQDNFLSLDSSYNAWDYQGKAEEYAVAGVLYDLYDGKAQEDTCSGTVAYLIGRMANSPHLDREKKELAMAVFTRITAPRESWEGEYQDDDGISLSLSEIWAVMKGRHPDFTSVYHGFVQRYPSRKAEIDAVFRDHGFFFDKSTGNGTYDPGEPFRDADANSIYDPGEYFIDSGQYFLDASFPDSRVDKPHFDPATDTIGTATNYQRPWRLTTQKLPGHFVQVNNQVPFYTFVVDYPGTQRSGYSALVRNNDGLIYVPVPPDAGARITVSALGVTTGNPLVFTSDQFHDNYLTAVKQGYYTSHDFRVSGPIPAPPVTPDFSKGSYTRKQSAGLFSAKGPLYDLFIGHSTGRAPIIVPAIIAIIGLVIIIYVLKKEG